VIVESLYEDYRAAFDSGWRQLQEKFTGLQELRDVDQTDPTRVLDMIIGPIEGWRTEREQLRERFEEDVKVLLNNDQRDHWPAFERRMRREKTLHQGRLSGETLNLFHIVRDLRLDQRTEQMIQPVMEQYDIALDYALRMRNEALVQKENEQLRQIRGGNMEAMVGHTEREVTRRLAVRAVNDEYIENIAAALPQPHGDSFRASALERAYPRVHRPLPAQRLFQEARRIDGLSAETVEVIAVLEEQFLAEMRQINESILASLRSFEPESLRHAAKAVAARQSGESLARLTDPTNEQVRERDTRATSYVERLRELIDPEQFAMLPGASRYIQSPQRAARPTQLSPGDESIAPTAPRRGPDGAADGLGPAKQPGGRGADAPRRGAPDPS
jgi:hypothetical protein